MPDVSRNGRRTAVKPGASGATGLGPLASIRRSDPARDEALIRRWIRPHPHKDGPEDVVLAESLVPVYAVIGYLPVAADNLDRVADAYDVPRAAVEAALAYYRQHQAVIDARIYDGTAKVSDAH